MAPDLTVVIPTLNAASVLPGQLEALAVQEWDGDWEVVVADNGSTDSTVAVASSYATRLPLRVVGAAGRRSPGAAYNVGAAASEARWLLFLDQDDEVAPGYVRAMAEALVDHDFVAARMDCTTLNPGWVAQSRAPAQLNGLGEGRYPYAYGGTLGVWRTAFEAMGGFDETWATAGDIDFSYRMALAGSPLTFVPDAVIRYRFRSTLPGLVRQAFAYGVDGARIRQRYAEAGPGLIAGLRVAAGATRLLLFGPGKGPRARGVYLLANRAGRIRGRWPQVGR